MIIYKTTNLINDKIYIGQSVDDNPSYLGSGTLLLIDIKAQGKENFKKEIIDTASTIEELNEKEKYWIEYYNSVNPKIGYNLSKGGTGYKTEKLNCKIQVLVTPTEYSDLSQLITTRALNEGRRPEPISSYVRLLIKKDIQNNCPEQKSFVKEAVKKTKN
jgi:hypothetical protein